VQKWGGSRDLTRYTVGADDINTEPP